MKILFVYRGFKSLGIGHLSSCLKKAGHKTDLYLDYALFDDGSLSIKFLSDQFDWKNAFRKKMESYQPDIVALSAATNMYRWACEAARVAKEYGVRTIIGGVHPTSVPEEVIKNKDFDILCIGEGEEAMVELASRLEAKEKINNIANLWIRENEAVITNEIRPLIQDLDKIPYPDFDLFYQYKGINKDTHWIISARGCPYSCTYCYNNSYKKIYKGKGKYVRRRSVDNVIDELKEAKDKYGLRFIVFFDDIFTMDIDWIRNFAARYRSEIDIPFHCSGRAELITTDIVDELKKCGCVEIELAVESGNKDIRNRLLKRNMSNEQISSAFNAIKKRNIITRADIMFGLPDETSKTMWESIELLKKCNIDFITYGIFYPYPKTELAEYAFRKGCFDYSETLLGNGGGIKAWTIMRHQDRRLINKYAYISTISAYLPLWFSKILLHIKFFPGTILHTTSLFIVYFHKSRLGRSNKRLELYKRAVVLLIKKFLLFKKEKIEFTL